MASLRCVESGYLYRNPKPHLYSRHAFFPSVVQLPGGDLLATFTMGQAFESADLASYVARSRDRGRTWAFEGPLYTGAKSAHCSNCCRIAHVRDNHLAAFVMFHDRTRADCGLANPENLGFVETELAIVESADAGRTWAPPRFVEPPLVGPSFEMNSPIVILRDGRWLIPTSTWRGWVGDCPNGMKAVAFVSHDQGRTWPEYIDVMADPAGAVIHWESKIQQLRDGRLLAVAWAYNEHTHTDLPNTFALSDSGAMRFGPAASTGLHGQTMAILPLHDDRILAVYRRMDTPGLWANISSIRGDEWLNQAEFSVWGENRSGLVKTSDNMTENFNVLKFGAPCLLHLDDGSVYGAFWAVEDGLGAIRYFVLGE